MTRLLPLLAVLACGGHPITECLFADAPDGVVQRGLAPPSGTDAVLAAAATRCPAGLDGYVTWVAELDACGWETGSFAGCGSISGCYLDATVVRVEPATSSALAHELGHWCLQTTDEDEANAWAATVNAAACN